MEQEKQSRGRPVGKEYSHVRSIRFDDVDLARIQALARKWRCSEAAAVRRAIAVMAEQESVE
jgi:predicted transcriptional regulator